MGAQQATGKTLLMPNDVCDEMNKFPQGLDRRSRSTKEFSKFSMSQYRIAEARVQSPAWLQIQQHMKDGFPDAKQSRAIACMVGLACGDAVGAPLEFLPLNTAGYGCTGVGYEGRGNKFQLLPGQWTDDTSMSLCLADSLIQHPDFAPRDLRLRFMNWWQFGYNNAFGAGEFLRGSVGLGGNISESFNEFLKEKTDYTTAGDNKTSGNGSLMRLAPCAVRFWGSVDRAMDVAALQSKTTHQGDEAAECCRLLAFVICNLIAFDGDAAAAKQEVLGKLGERFVSSEYSVQRLAAAEDEESHPSNGNGVELEERRWSWKRDDFEYSVKRSTEQPGYIGSYCMDGLSMALHCVWVTTDFRSAVIKAVDMGGDADTVGAIAAQIAGALYGAESIPADWIAAVQQWDGAGSIAYRASLLFEMGKPA